ncbi:hypothetical protein KJ966_00280 [bacterium]|nr:hypothetical protein [bacterium]
MNIKITDEALPLWNRLSDEEKKSWTSNVTCQKCHKEINAADFSGSLYEGQLALFHMCTQCSNKEVRLIDVEGQTQKDIDDDFEQWVKAKKAAHPEKFRS